jgi:hypothetical protein
MTICSADDSHTLSAMRRPAASVLSSPVLLSLLLVASITMGPVGCSGDGDARPASSIDTSAIHQRYGQTDQVTTTLVLRVRQPDRETLTFTADCWLDADNTIRLKATKMGIAFLDAVINPDQSFTALLVRDDEVITGSLGDLAPRNNEDAAAGSILINLAQFTAEAKTGPFPANTIADPAGTLSAALDDATSATITLGRDGFSVTEKTIIMLGEEKFFVTYKENSYQALANRLWRPTRADITFPNSKVQLSVKVRDLQPLNELPGNIFNITIPPGAKHIDAATLRNRLTE